MNFVACMLSPIVKEFLNWPTFLKVMNEYQVARFSWLTV